MAELFKFDIQRNEHDLEHALVMLRNKVARANEHGDEEAAEFLMDMYDRLVDAYSRALVGVVAEVEWRDWQILKAASDWARGAQIAAIAVHIENCFEGEN